MAFYDRSSGGGTGSSFTSQSILDKYQQMYQEAKTANEQRYNQGMGILDQAIARYQPGGGFGEGAMAQYEQGKTQALAGGMQSLVNAGLSNTTVAAGLPLAYEQQVGTPFRLQLEDMRMGNLTEAERAKTGFIEARQDPYPDYGLFANLAMQAGMQSGGGGLNYVGSPFPSDQPGYTGIMSGSRDVVSGGGGTSGGGLSSGSLGSLGGGMITGQPATSGNMNPYYVPPSSTGGSSVSSTSTSSVPNNTPEGGYVVRQKKTGKIQVLGPGTDISTLLKGWEVVG